MSDHRTERDRPAPAGAPRRRRGGARLAALAVAIVLLCIALLTIAVVPAVGSTTDDRTAESSAATSVENRTAPGSTLARTVVTHEARLGASFEASALEEDLDRRGSDRERALRLQQFSDGLNVVLTALQRRHRTVTDRQPSADAAPPSVRTDLARTEARARAVEQLAQRADATVESLHENATRDTGVGPDEFDQHAASSAEITGNGDDTADRNETDRSDSGAGFLIGDHDDAEPTAEHRTSSCDKHRAAPWTSPHGLFEDDAAAGTCENGTEPSRERQRDDGTAHDDGTYPPSPGFGDWSRKTGSAAEEEETALDHTTDDGANWWNGGFAADDERGMDDERGTDDERGMDDERGTDDEAVDDHDWSAGYTGNWEHDESATDADSTETREAVWHDESEVDGPDASDAGDRQNFEDGGHHDSVDDSDGFDSDDPFDADETSEAVGEAGVDSGFSDHGAVSDDETFGEQSEFGEDGDFEEEDGFDEDSEFGDSEFGAHSEFDEDDGADASFTVDGSSGDHGDDSDDGDDWDGREDYDEHEHYGWAEP